MNGNTLEVDKWAKHRDRRRSSFGEDLHEKDQIIYSVDGRADFEDFESAFRGEKRSWKRRASLDESSVRSGYSYSLEVPKETLHHKASNLGRENGYY